MLTYMSNNRLYHFNPRSHERSDNNSMCLWYRQFLFQSTLPREERQQTAAADVKREDISIHAPTRGATQKLGIASVKMYDFNPRSHERSDPCGWCYRLRQIYFNPRSHERSDGDVNKIDCGGSVISIHAPTRGATFVPRRISRYIVISIHAPTRGATPDPFFSFFLNKISIHAPTRGATVYFSLLK